jgi:hypothetical protein
MILRFAAIILAVLTAATMPWIVWFVRDKVLDSDD